MENAKCLYLMGVDVLTSPNCFEPLSVSDISLSDVMIDQDVNNGSEEIFVLRFVTFWGTLYGEDQVKVHKSKFVCRVCMNAYQEGQVLIMTKCDCKYILIHQECQIEWSKNTGNCKCCDACKQEIRNIPVILSETIKETFIPCEFMECSSRPRSKTPQNPREEMEDNFLIVKVKTPQNNVVVEQDQKIPKMEAICKICFRMLKENSVDALIKKQCGCEFTLVHEKCAIKFSENIGNNICEACEEDVQSIPVILSSPNINNKNQENTGSFYERIMKRISRLFYGFGKA